MDLKGAKILLVDDTQANLDILCQVLEPEGYSISMAPNGEVALRIVERVMPDLILLDVMMPGIDGFEVCRRLKADEKTQEIPVIFITAEADTTRVVTGFDVGGVDYILKPFREEEVVVRVETHLKINHLTRELAQKNDELSEANAHIREATERKSRFLASMAHELRTPLTAIMGYVDNMLEGIGGELSERQQHVLGRVGENSDHLLNLVNDLLDLSKIEAGRMELNLVPVNLTELIDSCADTVRPIVADGVTLSVDVDEQIGDVCSDSSWLRQILMNLSGKRRFNKCKCKLCLFPLSNYNIINAIVTVSNKRHFHRINSRGNILDRKLALCITSCAETATPLCIEQFHIGTGQYATRFFLSYISCHRTCLCRHSMGTEK